MITLEIYEENGTNVGGRGTITVIDNINWKSSADIAELYNFNPLRTPEDDGSQTLSFKKYNFFKISGTYSQIKDIRMTIEQVLPEDAGEVQLFYKWAFAYEVPTNAYDPDMIAIDQTALPITLFPKLSTVSPIVEQDRVTHYGPNQTVYTCYLVTQIRVTKTDWVKIGNSKQFKLSLVLKEFE